MRPARAPVRAAVEESGSVLDYQCAILCEARRYLKRVSGKGALRPQDRRLRRSKVRRTIERAGQQGEDNPRAVPTSQHQPRHVASADGGPAPDEPVEGVGGLFPVNTTIGGPKNSVLTDGENGRIVWPLLGWRDCGHLYSIRTELTPSRDPVAEVRLLGEGSLSLGTSNDRGNSVAVRLRDGCGTPPVTPGYGGRGWRGRPWRFSA
jgi:hypothetical protein